MCFALVLTGCGEDTDIGYMPDPVTTAGNGAIAGFDGAAGASMAGAGGFDGTAGTGGSDGTAGTGGVDGTAGTGGVDGTAGTGGVDGTAGTGGVDGTAGTGGFDGTAGTGGVDGTAGTGGVDGNAGSGGTITDGSCCSDGNCICRGRPPSRLSADPGPYRTANYSLRGVGCIYHPTNADGKFSAVAVSDGFLGTGGCGRTQTSGWGPLFASHGIVTMIIETRGDDRPNDRGRKLLAGVAGLKAENTNRSSPLFGKLAGRYGTAGFSMGGGGTSYAASQDSSLLSSFAIMPYGTTRRGNVPTLVTCGSSDSTAPCSRHGRPLYDGLPNSTPKLIVTLRSGHVGQPTAASNMQGAWGLAFQKLYLDGDERWKSVLLSGNNDRTNIR